MEKNVSGLLQTDKEIKQHTKIGTVIELLPNGKQSPSENRTVVGFRIRFLSGRQMVWFSNAFENRTNGSGFRMANLDCFIHKEIFSFV
jgi:hypothetical protein